MLGLRKSEPNIICLAHTKGNPTFNVWLTQDNLTFNIKCLVHTRQPNI
jgi:hypothetical protein